MANVGKAGETPKPQVNQCSERPTVSWQVKAGRPDGASEISIWNNGKLTEAYLVEGGNVSASAKYSYDEKGNLVLAEVDNDNDGKTDVEESYTYDDLNRVKTQTHSEFGLSKSISEYEYEGQDTRPSKVTITTDNENPQTPDTKEVHEYMYDGNKVLEKVDTDGNGTVDVIVSYDPEEPHVCPADVKGESSAPEPDKPNQPKELPENGA